jgi:hypothetical protein
MVVKINSNSTPEQIQKALKKLGMSTNESKKGKKYFDAFKYNGIIKLKEDPLLIQKSMRNEWQ